MKFAKILTCAALLALGVSFASAADSLDLRVESRVNPLGVETQNPRFSWELAAGGSQVAYQILVASSAEKLAAGQGDLWDSGRVNSSESFQIAYAGKALAAGQRAFWRVTYWAANGKPIVSEPAMFSMGALKPSDWTGKWIGFPNDDAMHTNEPAPCFRKEFAIAKPIARATVNICGLGQYELTLNGQKVGDAVLGEAWTVYNKSDSYDTFDVTAQLKQGQNAVGIMLGNGMYNVLRAPGRYSKFIGNVNTGTLANPKTILQLHIEYTDGTDATVVTDGSWKAARGPVTFNSAYGGEDYDGRREMPGWNSAGFHDDAWAAAAVVSAPGNGEAKLVAAVNPPIKVHQSFSPVKVMQPVPGVWVYDMGQNLCGWPRLKVKGPAGATVRMIPTELLYRDGTVAGVVSADRGLNWYSYTLKGTGEEEWTPRFSTYGFRYIEVTGAMPPEGTTIAATVLGGIGRQPPPLGTIPEPTAQILEIHSDWLYADAAVDGHFESSDETLNRIHRLINAAIVSNMQSILTDCPQREKLGWLEQAHLMSDSIAMNYDISGLYAKMCMDIRDTQTADGLVPTIAPEYTVFKNSYRDSPEWGATAILAPWALYSYYGDTRTIEANYDSMKRYMTYIAGKADGQIVSWGLGDWCDVTPEGKGGNPPKNTTAALTGTAIYFQDAKLMEKAARLLKHEDDARTYAALAESIRKAFNAKFYNRETGQYERGSETANAMPLALGMVDDANRDTVAKHLAEGVREVDYHITAGDVGFVYVINALINAQQGDVVYQMLTQTSGPGYVMQLNNGATTLTEMWNGGNSSNDHLMLGHGELWFYRGLAGIQSAPGSVEFQDIVIRPEVVERIAANSAGEKFARASYNSVRGPIVSNWSLKGKALTMDVTIPASSTATIYVPAGDPKAAQVISAKGGTAKLLRTEEHAAVYSAGGGIYQFAATLP